MKNKQISTAFALAMTLFILVAAVAGETPRPYDNTLNFAEVTPATITANEYEPFDVQLLGYKPMVNRFALALVAGSFTSASLDASFIATPVTHAFASPPRTVSSLRVPGIPAGEYTFNLRYHDGSIADTRRVSIAARGMKTRVETYGKNGALRFALATSDAEAFRLFGSSGVAADSSFAAWLATGDAPTTATPVFRMKFIYREAETGYFFTADAREVAILSTLPGWSNDGVAFRALSAEANVCGIASRPVYRAFRPLPVFGGTHRYTTDESAYREWIRGGQWVGEGLVFCAPDESR